MRKFLVSCFCLLNASLFASADADEGTLASKVIITDESGFYSLTDGSIWKVFGLRPRWRSISEWWNSVKIVPEDFECVINDFYPGAKLKLIPKNEYEALDISNAANKEALARCSHVLLNSHTGKCVFAVLLRPETAIVELYNESYKTGYSSGYQKGRLSTDVEAYNQYEKGYQAGYRNGVKDARSNTVNANPNALD